MEKEFIPHQQSFDMKELGFDEPCFAYYNGYKELDHLMPERVVVGRNYNGDTITSAPLYQQAFRWFSKKHRIEGWIQPFLSLEPRKCQARYWDGGKTPCEGISIGVYDTYEEAQLECLKKLIEIVKEITWEN